MWCIVGRYHISVPKYQMASGNMEIRIQIIILIILIKVWWCTSVILLLRNKGACDKLRAA